MAERRSGDVDHGDACGAQIREDGRDLYCLLPADHWPEGHRYYYLSDNADVLETNK